TNFVAGATTASLSGSGTTAGYSINVSNVNVTSNTSLSAVATIGASTPIGVYVLGVSTANGSASGPSFSVTPSQLTVNSLTPSSGVRGSILPITITGTGFMSGATSVSISGSGSPVSLSVTNVNVANNTSLTGFLTIP